MKTSSEIKNAAIKYSRGESKVFGHNVAGKHEQKMTDEVDVLLMHGLLAKSAINIKLNKLKLLYCINAAVLSLQPIKVVVTPTLCELLRTAGGALITKRPCTTPAL